MGWLILITFYYLYIDTPNRVAFFIDCNCMETCRVGGGPINSGPNAGRKDPIIQRAFYNGWKSVHGLKHQTVEAAIGLCVHIWGPVSLRRNDRYLLRESKIHEQIKALSPLFSIFGEWV